MLKIVIAKHKNTTTRKKWDFPVMFWMSLMTVYQCVCHFFILLNIPRKTLCMIFTALSAASPRHEWQCGARGFRHLAATVWLQPQPAPGAGDTATPRCSRHWLWTGAVLWHALPYTRHLSVPSKVWHSELIVVFCFASLQSFNTHKQNVTQFLVKKNNISYLTFLFLFKRRICIKRET